MGKRYLNAALKRSQRDALTQVEIDWPDRRGLLERLALGLWERYPTDEARYTRLQAIAVAAINAHKVAKKAGVPDRERFAALSGMLDDSHEGSDGKGIWLWTLAAGLLLFVMEFILFAALVPTDWARQVSARELASLVDAVGPVQADIILDRAVRWYRACCVRTGLEAWSYHVLVPDHRMAGAGLEKLADSPVWPWLAGRVQVVWWSIGQACQRLAVLLFWWPFMLILFPAAAYDALLRRRIRQHSFSYASPLIHFWSEAKPGSRWQGADFRPVAWRGGPPPVCD